jgi:hypothetical protein
MGFYLPGIGEALGSYIRLDRQEKLMASVQGILKDETKPWAERAALVTAAHPELATNENFKQMVELGTQADEAKYQQQKRAAEVEQLERVGRFNEALSSIADPAARVEFLRKNAELAAQAAPEEWKGIKAADKRQQELEDWGYKNSIESSQRDYRAAVAAGAAAGKEQRAEQRWVQGQIAAGLMDPSTGAPILPQQREQQAAQLAIETDAAKKRTSAGLVEEQKKAIVDNATVGIDNLITDLEQSGREWFGEMTEAGSVRESKRQSLGLLLAQMANPGRAPTDADVKVAMARIPDPSLFGSSPTAAIKQLEQLKKDLGGFKKAPPSGFVED